MLVTKARRAAREHGAKGLCLAGGVAANSQLRERLLDACVADGLRAFLPSRSMCTDNAAMVAAAGWYRLQSDGPSPLDTGASPNLPSRARARRHRPTTRVVPGRSSARIVSTRPMRVLSTLVARLLIVSFENRQRRRRNMSLQPLEDRIVVRPGQSEETTASGLVIPDTAKEKPQQGEVLAVGPGRRSETSGELHPGRREGRRHRRLQQVRRHRDHRDGEDVLILNARDVLAVIS